MIYSKFAYIKVVGFVKFVKNIQNTIDMVLISVYILYTVIRFIHPSNLPDKKNTMPPDHPTLWLGISIVLNLLITMLIISKLMIIIKINQSFS